MNKPTPEVPDLFYDEVVRRNAIKMLELFTSHYERWMDEYPDSDQSSCYARHTLGDIRNARAAAAALKARPAAPAEPVGVAAGYVDARSLASLDKGIVHAITVWKEAPSGLKPKYVAKLYAAPPAADASGVADCGCSVGPDGMTEHELAGGPCPKQLDPDAVSGPKAFDLTAQAGGYGEVSGVAPHTLKDEVRSDDGEAEDRLRYGPGTAGGGRDSERRLAACGDDSRASGPAAGMGDASDPIHRGLRQADQGRVTAEVAAQPSPGVAQDDLVAPVACWIQREVLGELKKYKGASGTVSSGLLKKPFGDPVPLYDGARLRALELALTQIQTSAKVSVKEMRLSDGRSDFYVSIQRGGREVTPHAFRERFKAEYHVALYDWLLNGGDEPCVIDFNENDWPAKHGQTSRNKDGETIEGLRGENAELQQVFDLQWAADQRGIDMWREGHPERQLTRPDHAKLVAWLLERLTAAEATLAGVEAERDRLRYALERIAGANRDNMETLHPEAAPDMARNALSPAAPEMGGLDDL